MEVDGLYKTAEGAALRFWEEPAINNFASEKHGRPLYDKCLFVEVITPGSRESAPVFELERVFCKEAGIDEPRRNHKYGEYKQQIDAYRAGTESRDLTGTPLSAWPAIDSAIAAALKHVGVFTVEGLAALPDSRYHVVGPGALSLVTRARAFLEAAAGNADNEGQATRILELETASKEKDGQIADMNNRLSQALAELAQVRAALPGTAETLPPPPPPPAMPDLSGNAPPPPPLPPAPPAQQEKAKKGGGNKVQTDPII